MVVEVPELLARVVRVAHADAAQTAAVAAHIPWRAARRAIDQAHAALRTLMAALGDQAPREWKATAKLALAAMKQHKRCRASLTMNGYERRVIHNARVSLRNVLRAESLVAVSADDAKDVRSYVDLYEEELARNGDRFAFQFEPIATVGRPTTVERPKPRTSYEIKVSKRAVFYLRSTRKYRVVLDAHGALRFERSGRLVHVADAKYVFATSGELFVAHLDALNKRRGRLLRKLDGRRYDHPSLLPKGSGVLAAGRCTVDEGVLVQFDNASQHFQPSVDSLNRFFFGFLCGLGLTQSSSPDKEGGGGGTPANGGTAAENTAAATVVKARVRWPLVVSYFPPGGTVGGKNFGLASPLAPTEALALDAKQRLVRVGAGASTTTAEGSSS